METLLYSEINILCITMLVVIATKAEKVGIDKRFKNTLFTSSVWFATAANFFDFLWNLCNSELLKMPIPIMMMLNSLYFVSFGLSGLLWLLYSETPPGESWDKNRRVMFLEVLPLLALIALLAISVPTGCLYYFDENGVYHRGSLFYTQQVLSYGYFFIASINTLNMAMQENNYAFRDDLLSNAGFIIPPVICIVFQYLFRGLPILSVGIVVSYFQVYLSGLHSQIALDTLTGISNRRQLLVHLANVIKMHGDEEKIYFCFLDIDKFKQINDIYGHNEGDNALIAVSAALKKVCAESGGFCARYGGDEFAVVQQLKTDESISDIMAKIQSAVEGRINASGLDYKVKISTGCAQYADGESIAELIQRADKDMYIQKTHGGIELQNTEN